jgi:ribulose-bisphosphate carboxylase large chain
MKTNSCYVQLFSLRGVFVIQPNPKVEFSGERFKVKYSLTGYGLEDAQKIAQFICVEDTIEFPYELVAEGEYRDQMVGQVEDFQQIEEDRYQTLISYAVEVSGFELPQLLNVIYGNITFVHGIRVESLELATSLMAAFQGPRYGLEGIRDLVDEPTRPLVSTALKPMGLSVVQLAEMAYQCALGGIDIIKDDHGLSDQSFCPYRERIPRCVEAVNKANQETGFRSLYFPAVNGKMEEFWEKAHFAKEQGADGLMLMPGLCGIDTARMLAEDESLGLPVLYHPGFLGTYRMTSAFGISPFVLHGQLARLIGADISIFPHHGGRFSPPAEESRQAIEGLMIDMGTIKKSMPSPGGGVKPESLENMVEFYGRDVICLAAGNLHRLGPDLTENSRVFRENAESLA